MSQALEEGASDAAAVYAGQCALNAARGTTWAGDDRGRRALHLRELVHVRAEPAVRELLRLLGAHLAGVDADAARARLEASDGSVRKAAEQ